MMPVLLFWPVPAATIVGGYYLATTAKVMDAALALAILGLLLIALEAKRARLDRSFRRAAAPLCLGLV
jgi:hypothetical protein